ncbi:MAG TPA: putative inorganic carbon transporter subunit DabA, partial [Haliangium sp.]|nr:putative inorganic carbon transporter subunit DabA [Haliangium sp.]
MQAAETPPRGDSLAEQVLEALHHAAHYLPDQGPIGVFIHHNTLHAFEKLSFHEAIAQATALFGAEPYMTEEAFRRCHAEGRIETADIDAAIAADGPDDAVLGTAAGRALRRHELRRLAMLHPMAAETPAGLRYLLTEGALDTRLATDVPASAASRIIEEGLRYVRGLLSRGSDDEGVKALATALAAPGDAPDTARARLVELCHGATGRKTIRHAIERDPETFAVKALWARCQALTRSLPGAAPSPAARAFRLGPDGTHRDLLQHLTGEDTDELVNPEMLRLASAYLDLGMAYWPMPEREQGFYAAVRALMADAPRPAAAWLRAAANELRDRARRGDQAVDVILASIAELGVPEERLGDYFTRLLRAQPGWAGMMSRLERHPEDRPSDSPPASLADFTAVRLIFERAAVRQVARTALGWRGPLAELVDRFGRDVSIPAPASGDHDRAYRLFRVLSVAGISAAGAMDLETASAGKIIAELEAFDELARRRTFHEAYERYHRRQILDALAAHRPHVRVGRPVDVPRFQVIVCIDERE